jgi:hypothetical protein
MREHDTQPDDVAPWHTGVLLRSGAEVSQISRTERQPPEHGTGPDSFIWGRSTPPTLARPSALRLNDVEGIRVVL